MNTSEYKCRFRGELRTQLNVEDERFYSCQKFVQISGNYIKLPKGNLQHRLLLKCLKQKK